MARGWESKDVESQMEERRERSADAFALSPAELDRQKRRESLLLTRIRVLRDLQQACNPRHRGILEASLAHLDAQIAELDAPSA